jgi:hypothetical protein
MTFSSWWGRHSVEAGRIDYWQIGPLNLWIQHLAHQWRFSWVHSPDWLDPRVRSVPSATQESIPPEAENLHCAFLDSREDLIFAPTLANRPVVTRLATPLQVIPGENVTLYVVSPLWLRVEMAQPSKPLHEFPIFRLSDTWFGPMSSAGSLCYASSSPAFLELREVPLRMHCAITAVTIRNSSANALPIDRLNIPLPQLSLFYSPRTGFWTDAITLEHNEGAEMATLRIDRQPPADAAPTQFVTGPRQTVADTGTVFRAFSAFFRERNEA